MPVSCPSRINFTADPSLPSTQLCQALSPWDFLGEYASALVSLPDNGMCNVLPHVHVLSDALILYLLGCCRKCRFRIRRRSLECDRCHIGAALR